MGSNVEIVRLGRLDNEIKNFGFRTGSEFLVVKESNNIFLKRLPRAQADKFQEMLRLAVKPQKDVMTILNKLNKL